MNLCSLVRVIWVILVHCHFTLCFDSLDLGNCDHARRAFVHSLETSERATDFVLRNYNLMNIDAFFGVRIAEGQLSEILRKWKQFFPLNHNEALLYLRIRRMLEKQNEAAEMARSYLKETFHTDYEGYKKLLAAPFFYQGDYFRADLREVYRPQAYSAEVLDSMYNCTFVLLTSRKQCHVPQRCWDTVLETALRGDGYITTHLAMYLVLAAGMGCREVLIERAGSEQQYDRVRKYFGVNIYSQALTNFQNATTKEDLFFEEIIFCSNLGTIDCLNLNWLDAINSWQEEFGCWQLKDVNHSWVKTVHKSTDHGDDEIREEKGWSSRKLLSDIVYDDGCSVHKTGLGVAVVSLHLHWLMFPPSYHSLGMRSPLGENCHSRSYL